MIIKTNKGNINLNGDTVTWDGQGALAAVMFIYQDSGIPAGVEKVRYFDLNENNAGHLVNALELVGINVKSIQ